jgi:hypothetical protein
MYDIAGITRYLFAQFRSQGRKWDHVRYINKCPAQVLEEVGRRIRYKDDLGNGVHIRFYEAHHEFTL